jgi:hypothetical protein
MKGNLEHLLRERFQGHEAPVDPGVWDAIQGQLTQAAPAADAVNDLFRERFAGHEVPVDPAVWQGVSKQLGHSPAGNGTWGWAASAAAVLVVGVGLWWSNSESPAPLAEQRSAPSTELAPTAAVPVEAIPNEAAPSTNAPAQASGAAQAPVTNATPTATRSNEGAPQPTGLVQPTTTPVDPEGPATPMLPPTPKAATPPPVLAGQQQAPNSTPVADPQRVEAIIQTITERTKTEALAADEKEPEPLPEQPLERAEECLEPFLPNTFTPNGDQVNDTYQVDQEGFRSMLIRVLSMKNDKLVFSTNSGEPWTGDGCEDGMYVVVVEAITLDGRPVSKAKVVWLNRDRMN